MERLAGFLEREDPVDDGAQPRRGDRPVHRLEACPAPHEDAADRRHARRPGPAGDLDRGLGGAPRNEEDDLAVEGGGPHRLLDGVGPESLDDAVHALPAVRSRTACRVHLLGSPNACGCEPELHGYSMTPSRPLWLPMYQSRPWASTVIFRMPTPFDGSG